MARITVFNKREVPIPGIHVMAVSCRGANVQKALTNNHGQVNLQSVPGRTEIFVRDHAGQSWQRIGEPLRSLRKTQEFTY